MPQLTWKPHLTAPAYDYPAEVEHVVDRLAALPANRTRKAMIELFDDKPTLFGFVASVAFFENVQAMSYEDTLMLTFGASVAELDATVQTWREKVHSDLVRPTTVIQRAGDRLLYTYNGDQASSKPEHIAARDFQTYLRTMPHAEFPSASAGLCTAYAEFVDALLVGLYGTALADIVYPLRGPSSTTTTSSMPQGLPGGDGSVQGPPRNGGGPQGPPRGPPASNPNGPAHGAPRLHFKDMQQMADLCGESRLWGGMHFTAAVPAGAELAKGIGTAAVQYITELRAGDTWEGPFSQNRAADWSRPACQ